jgi:hypothetical protein
VHPIDSKERTRNISSRTISGTVTFFGRFGLGRETMWGVTVSLLFMPSKRGADVSAAGATERTTVFVFYRLGWQSPGAEIA